jgi:uncharacterized DUF497 family protein
MEFEWDARKAAENLSKHGVDFVRAVRIFSDPHRLERESDPETYGEVRRKVLGLIDGDVYAVVYTPRSDVYRIISARKASKREREQYRTSQNAA